MTETEIEAEMVKINNDVQPIKVESVERSSGEDGTEGNVSSDIQNYLQTFNKEIQIVQGDSGSQNDAAQGDVDSQSSTYYVTDSGEYFYQTNDVNNQIVSVMTDNKEDGLPNKKSSQKDVTNNDQTKVNELQSGQLVLEETLQTVTIVPTETNPGEVSYVLIVQQPDGENENKREETCNEGDDQDLTVYDFDEAEDPAANESPESADEDDKSSIMKIVARKSQTVAQAHMCNYCNYTSPKRYLLSRHMKSHSEERPHKCNVCDRGFKTIASLQNHVNTHTGTKPHHCKFCDSHFTTSGELVRHVRYKHTHEKPHKCSICDYASVELSKMRNHMRCHTGERPYQCNHCTYASPDSFKLKRHLRIHTGERPYECDICKARFTQSNSLKAHKLIHCDDGDKPVFKCDLCPATCSRKTDLRIHVQKLHTSDRLLTCRRCGENFPDRYSFKEHNKSHGGEKCWKCDVCEYASASHRHLESHMLIHTDQKPFRCSLCDQSFRQKQLLKRHQNLYHNPSYVAPPPKEKTHRCPECHRAFRHKGNLIRHMCVHDPESEAMKKQMALKLGRQKKITVVNGEEIKVVQGDSDIVVKEETIELDSKTIKSELGTQLIEGADGQQYVVLEVIQLQGSDGEHAVAVVSGNDFESGTMTIDESGNLSTTQYITSDCGSGKLAVRRSSRKITKKTPDDAVNDVQNCFGFDDDEEEEDEVEDDEEEDEEEEEDMDVDLRDDSE